MRAQGLRQCPEELLIGNQDVAPELIILLEPADLPAEAGQQIESAVAVQLDVAVMQQQLGEVEAAILEGQIVMDRIRLLVVNDQNGRNIIYERYAA